MKKSPDTLRIEPGNRGAGLEDKHFEADLAAEDRIQSSNDLIDHPDFEADRALRMALGQIEAPELPQGLRRTVLEHSQGPQQRWTWMAIAAAVVLSVVVVTALDPLGSREPSPQISAEDWAQLALAVETLDTQGRQIAQITQRQVGPHLSLPGFDLPSLHMRIDPLPYPDSFRRWFQPNYPQTR